MKQRAYKYRFYPTEAQIELLAKTFGCVRVVYNKALHLRQESYLKDKTKISYHATSSALTEWKKEDQLTWLNEVSCVPLQQSLRHLQKSFTNFFMGRSKYPKFKKKTSKQSAEFTKSGFKWHEGEIYIAKSKEPLNIVWSREFENEPSTITVSKDPSGRYFVSVLVEENIKKLKKSKNVIGIDLGITDLATLSTGEKIKGPKATKANEKKLAKLQRRLSKKQKGSTNRNKARLKVAKLQAKIADTRKDFNHKLSTRLIRENQSIAVETLVVKNMVKNRKLSKSISDAGWSQLLGFLQYKAEWYGREMLAVDRWFPSSKRCSDCGHTVDKLPLSVRVWTCKECGAKHDRDVNAARNILAAGLAASAFGENVNLVSSGISSPR